MADTGLSPRSPLTGILRPGRHGIETGAAGVWLEERIGLQIVSLATRNGRAAEVAQAVRQAWRLDLPTIPRRVGDASLAFVWAGAGQWLAVAEGWKGDLETSLRAELAGLASITDQSAGRAVIRIGGSHARLALAKGIAVDLHPRAFRPGDTALTLASEIGVQIWQLDDTPAYDILTLRSYAGNLCGWLLAAGAEYGIDVAPQG